MVEQADTGCCEETKTTNPKTDFRKKKRKGLDLYSLQNPIDAEVEDATELKKFFKQNQFVPFAGTNASSGHALLAWYTMLSKLSCTTRSCINKKLLYAFGSKAQFVTGQDFEYNLGEEVVDLSMQTKLEYRKALKEVAFLDGTIQQFHTKIGHSYLGNGNSFVELSIATVNGQSRAAIKAHNTANVMYVNTDIDEARVIGVSSKWDTNYLKKHPARLVPIYPIWVKSDDGEMRTMFHLKAGDNTWYGRPESEGGDLYKYREVQDAMYILKQAAANFTGQLVIEVEDDDPEANAAINDASASDAGFNSFIDRFEQNYTQKANDPQSVVVTSRPFGSRPMFVFQVKPNTSEKWYEVTGKLNRDNIYRAESVTARFMGEDVAGGFSQDQFVSDYVINVEPAINALRNKILAFTNGILNVVWEQLGKDFSGVNITFAAPIQSAIDDLKSRPESQQQQTTQE